MTQKKTVLKSNTNKKVLAAEIAAGVIVAASAAAAGYYFYGAKDAKKHRAAAASWAKKMKSDVVKEAKKLSKLDKKAVGIIVDRAVATYKNMRAVDKNNLAAAAKELKANWQELERELASSKQKSIKIVKKGAKKVVKAATAKKSK